MRDGRTTNEQLKIELLSQWKLEAEFCKYKYKHKHKEREERLKLEKEGQHQTHFHIFYYPGSIKRKVSIKLSLSYYPGQLSWTLDHTYNTHCYHLLNI